MLIPSIDIEGGRCVQLIGGEELAIDAGSPEPWARRYGRVGEIAVIDLDAAKGEGTNAEEIRPLLATARCRVGGGVRDARTALGWLNAGAERVIIGTAATPELLAQLPAERVIVALDCRGDEVVVNGWRTGTGARVEDRMRQLAGLASGFLVTFVEREGRLQGTRMDRVASLVEAAGDARVTIAGGVTTAAEVGEIDRMGADAQVGMALYSGQLQLADAFAAPLVSDRADGLWATVVVDPQGRALGLCWSDRESLGVALQEGVGAYRSRRRGLWIKGATSGATQDLVRVEVDCDRDSLRFVVRQRGTGFCHRATATCWGPARGLQALEATVRARLEVPADRGSWTARLAGDPALLGAKLREEAAELAVAVASQSDGEVAAEAADLLYFLTVALATRGVSNEAVDRELDRRTGAIRRRLEELER